jgi:hypothetical protein
MAQMHVLIFSIATIWCASCSRGHDSKQVGTLKKSGNESNRSASVPRDATRDLSDYSHDTISDLQSGKAFRIAYRNFSDDRFWKMYLIKDGDIVDSAAFYEIYSGNVDVVNGRFVKVSYGRNQLWYSAMLGVCNSRFIESMVIVSHNVVEDREGVDLNRRVRYNINLDPRPRDVLFVRESSELFDVEAPLLNENWNGHRLLALDSTTCLYANDTVTLIDEPLYDKYLHPIGTLTGQYRAIVTHAFTYLYYNGAWLQAGKERGYIMMPVRPLDHWLRK